MLSTSPRLQNDSTSLSRSGLSALCFPRLCRSYLSVSSHVRFHKGIELTSTDLPSFVPLNELQAITLSGILVSHMSHLGSVYVLYFLACSIYPQPSEHGMRVALGSAILHIISPAGLFLSSPYTESLFSFLNLSGLALYLSGISRVHGHATILQRCQLVAAGLMFGVATTVRSNGLFSGIPFLYDAFARTWAIVQHGLSNRRLYDLASLMFGGMLVASGLVIPQVYAYQLYCTDKGNSTKQPWCFKTCPSIYAWVQDHYW